MNIRTNLEKRIPTSLKKWIRKRFPFFFSCYNAAVEKNMKKSYRKYGIKAMQHLDECLRSAKIPYSLAFGTMLGAVRDHGFIPHDHDIDIWVWHEDDTENLIQQLQKYEFHAVRKFEVDKGEKGKVLQIEWKNCFIDVFFVYNTPEYGCYCCDFITIGDSDSQYNQKMPRRINLPICKDFDLKKFENLMLPVPVNAEELLTIHYGEDYMIPITKWNYMDGVKGRPHVQVWDEMLPLTTRFNY